MTLLADRTASPAPGPGTATRRSSAERLARWSTRHRWTSLLLWLLLVAVAVVGGSVAGIAATAVALNLLSVGAAYGLLTLVFQHGLATDLLGVQQSGFIVDWLPLFLFVILFGRRWTTTSSWSAGSGRRTSSGSRPERRSRAA